MTIFTIQNRLDPKKLPEEAANQHYDPTFEIDTWSDTLYNVLREYPLISTD